MKSKTIIFSSIRSKLKKRRKIKSIISKRLDWIHRIWKVGMNKANKQKKNQYSSRNLYQPNTTKLPNKKYTREKKMK